MGHVSGEHGSEDTWADRELDAYYAERHRQHAEWAWQARQRVKRAEEDLYWNSPAGRAIAALQEAQRAQQERESRDRRAERDKELAEKKAESERVRAEAAEAKRVADEAEAKQKALALAAQTALIPAALTAKEIAIFGKMWMPLAVATLNTWQKYRPEMVGLTEAWGVVIKVLDSKYGYGGERRKTVREAAKRAVWQHRAVIETGSLIAIEAVSKDLKAKVCSQCHGMAWYYYNYGEKECARCKYTGLKVKK